MGSPRRIVRWQDADIPTLGWDVPDSDYEGESSVEQTAATALAVGRDFPVALLGRGRPAVGAARETMRVTLSAATPEDGDAMWDELIRILSRVPRGVLIAQDGAGTEVEADAVLDELPTRTVAPLSWLRMPVSVSWVRLGPWHRRTDSVASATLSGTATLLDVAVGGTFPTRRVTVRLQASGGSIASPTISDLIRGTQVTIGLTLSGGHIVELDCEREVARRSTDGGATWTDVTAQVSVPATQVGWLALEPGSGQVRVSSASAMAGTVTLRWRDAWLM
jgi:hypothetical protein